MVGVPYSEQVVVRKITEHRIEVECVNPECDNTFTTFKNPPNRTKYCQRACYHKHRSNDPGLFGATEQGRWLAQKYGKRHGFARLHKIKTTSVETKKNVCYDCSSTTGLVLHHVDGDVSNHLKSNLMVLCKSCHIKRHEWLPYRVEYRYWFGAFEVHFEGLLVKIYNTCWIPGPIDRNTYYQMPEYQDNAFGLFKLLNRKTKGLSKVVTPNGEFSKKDLQEMMGE